MRKNSTFLLRVLFEFCKRRVRFGFVLGKGWVWVLVRFVLAGFVFSPISTFFRYTVQDDSICFHGVTALNRGSLLKVWVHWTRACCWLFRNGERVALKIIRNVDKYRESAKLEINVLQAINERDPNDEKSVYHCSRNSLSALMTSLGQITSIWQLRIAHIPHMLPRVAGVKKKILVHFVCLGDVSIPVLSHHKPQPLPAATTLTKPPHWPPNQSTTPYNSCQPAYIYLFIMQLFWGADDD